MKGKLNTDSIKPMVWFLTIGLTSGIHVEEFKEENEARELYEWCTDNTDNTSRELVQKNLYGESTLIIKKEDIISVKLNWYSKATGIFQIIRHVLLRAKIPYRINLDRYLLLIAVTYYTLFSMDYNGTGKLKGSGVQNILELIENGAARAVGVNVIVFYTLLLGFIINVLCIMYYKNP